MPSPKAMRPACIGLLSAAFAFGQGDPLVSKTVPLLLADKARFYAFGADGLKYSRIDLLASPPDIRNGVLPFKGGAEGGVGRNASVLLWINYRPSDTVTVGGIASLDREGKATLDTVSFRRSPANNNAINSGVQMSALALHGDTVVVGAGRAGIAVARPRSGGSDVLAADSLVFLSLPAGGDTAVVRLRCALDAACRVDSLAALAKTQGEPDSVTALAVSPSAPDSAWILIGTQAGLRRGLLGGTAFPIVPLPGEAGAVRSRIVRIHADPQRAALWVFTGSRYFFSDDHGRSFRPPPDVPGIATRPEADIKGFDPAPEAVSLGDTTWINFNLDQPGLVLFRRDSVLANAGDGAPRDVLLDAADGLEIARGQGKLTGLAAVRNGDVTALAVGTTGKGLFYRLSGPGRGGEWTNVNSLKRLAGGLGEIITFPTLFTGTGPNGDPEYVNIGYRLKKDGKVTITVFNYAMEKVKVLVKDAPRKGGGSRSEKPEDRWDGRDRSGRLVSVGTYYILVESDNGEKGWGKAIHLRGRN
jgi:hypothetical protein